jgi:hypothetical protein
MAWLSDVAALHKGMSSTRVASQRSIARFVFFVSSVTTFLLCALAVVITRAPSAIAAETHAVTRSVGEFVLPNNNAKPIDRSTPVTVQQTKTEIDADNPFCPRPIEAAQSDARSDNSSRSFPLPKRHPGRETGSQSNGSLRDSRASEEAPSADEPITFLSSGGGVCRGF